MDGLNGLKCDFIHSLSMAGDQIQEAELVSLLDGPNQSQASGSKMINVNHVDIAVENVHQVSCTPEGRRSGRKHRKRSFSPEVETMVRQKARQKINLLISKSGKRAEVEFCCDICKSPSITNPSRRGNRLRRSGYTASPRWKHDPETGKMLMLCNACGLAFGRSRGPHSSCAGTDADERRKHQEALVAFAVSMTELLGDQDAKMLCCPLFVKKPCQCLQNYIKKTGKRVKRTKGKGALGLLKPIAELVKERCCMDNCVSMAHTHGHLLHVWRERASKGQADARRALAEMLTPSGGSHSNCYRFISWVTGCSHSTISRVNEQMRRTGGEREPPPHGLKKCWKGKSKAQGMTSTEQTNTSTNTADFLNFASSVVSSGPSFLETSQVSMGNRSLPVELSSLPTSVLLQVQQQQIEALKKQVQLLQQQQQLQLQWEVTRAQPQPQHGQIFGTPHTLIPKPHSVQQPSNVITQRQPVGLQAKATPQQCHISKEGLTVAQILQNPGHHQMVNPMQCIGLQKNDLQAVQCQIQQDQQRNQQLSTVQLLDCGTVDGLVCNQSDAQQEVMAHLQHSPVQKNSLTRCYSTEEQSRKQLGPSNLQQAVQLITVTEDCHTPTVRVHR
ncbi:hypothetical protein chiPu_0009848 [Chiloscyllium punctatum]|uniref:Uncharacterized protein n=1 Tax=Chiloscyllium punctatum TaxID=137246 RepID=A0A401SLY9_CHIPU|nr:hypothetical protein [Chiloscyllium punctatum]